MSAIPTTPIHLVLCRTLTATPLEEVRISWEHHIRQARVPHYPRISSNTSGGFKTDTPHGGNDIVLIDTISGNSDRPYVSVSSEQWNSPREDLKAILEPGQSRTIIDRKKKIVAKKSVQLKSGVKNTPLA